MLRGNLDGWTRAHGAPACRERDNDAQRRYGLDDSGYHKDCPESAAIVA